MNTQDCVILALDIQDCVVLALNAKDCNISNEYRIQCIQWRQCSGSNVEALIKKELKLQRNYGINFWIRR